MIDIIAGARPNFVKIAPIIHELDKIKLTCPALSYRLIHTGQHYDKAMSESFFSQLDIPEPDINFGVGSASQAEQLSRIMLAYEKLLLKRKPNLTIVVGDVNSTMACAIVAKKAGVKVVHVEGGLRSYDWSMPEEINRMVTDSVTDIFFTTTTEAGQNLLKEGVDKRKIFFVGNTMIDTLHANAKRLIQPEIYKCHNLHAKKYIVLTMHRPSNVDSPEQTQQLLEAFSDSGNKMPVIFPAHPRTKETLQKISYDSDLITVVEPLSYLEFNFLVKNSDAVVTDSGGVTEEATVYGIPCITLRDSTERPETVTHGSNILVGDDLQLFSRLLNDISIGRWKKGSIPDRWDGKASMRIVDALQKRILVSSS